MSVVNVVLGIIIAGAAFMATTTSMFWSTLIVGLLVLVLAAYNAWVATQARTDRAVAPAGANILLGLWLVASVFVLPIANETLFWTNIALGLLVAVLASYNTWAGYKDRQAATV